MRPSVAVATETAMARTAAASGEVARSAEVAVPSATGRGGVERSSFWRPVAVEGPSSPEGEARIVSDLLEEISD